MQHRLLVATGTVGVLLLTGCGLRVNNATRQDLLTQSLRGGSGTGASGTVSGSGGSGGSTPGNTSSGTTGAVTTGGSGPSGSGTTGASGTSGAGPTGGGATGGTASAVSNGGATDVGVTATSLTVGLVADQTGPAPGIFNGDVAAAQAYFAYINSQGGVHGRKLNIKVADSGIDCNQTHNAYSSLAPNVFAFVSNLSNFDNCGAPVLKANPKIPDVSFALTPEHESAPSSFSVQPTVPGARTGPPLAFKQAFPDVVQSVGGLYSQASSAQSQWAAEKKTLQSVGYAVTYEQAVPTTEVDYTQYVIAMRQKNVKMVVLYNAAAANEKFVTAAQQQGWNPEVITAPGTMYDPSFQAAVGNTPTNLYDDQTIALYTSADEAKTIPGVALYQTWMHKTAPDQNLDQFSIFGWMEAGLFVQALKAAGPKATQASTIAALRSIHSYDSLGLVASGDPGAKKPVTCYLLMHYVNGTWKRFKTPATAFRCDAGYHYTG